VGRAPAYWSEENVKLIIEDFVPLSVYGADQGRKDAVGQFYRNAGLNLDKFEARMCCVTAGGKVLEEAGRSGIDLKNTLEKWNALPESDRTPGAVKVAERSPVDRGNIGPTPPVGGLILKVHTRVLMHDGEGQLRYVTGKDLWVGDQGELNLEADYQQGRTAAHEAQPHHMWLTEAECKSLMPANPKKGDVVPIPAGITDRILRWHLNPLRFYGRYGPDALERQDVRVGELKLTVHAVAPDVVRLRLDGFAKLGKVPPADVVKGKIASLDQWGYEPRVLGVLDYDPRKQVITRFDIVALGEHFGRLGLGRRAPSRIGLQPLGMAFQLVKGDQPADRVPPGRPSNSRSYYNLSK
jgi:hypothetical protein